MFRRLTAAIDRLSQATGRTRPGILLLYPTQAQLRAARAGQDWLAERADILAIAQDARWNGSRYRDGIHPTV